MSWREPRCAPLGLLRPRVKHAHQQVRHRPQSDVISVVRGQTTQGRARQLVIGVQKAVAALGRAEIALAASVAFQHEAPVRVVAEAVTAHALAECLGNADSIRNRLHEEDGERTNRSRETNLENALALGQIARCNLAPTFALDFLDDCEVAEVAHAAVAAFRAARFLAAAASAQPRPVAKMHVTA